jgi:TM2 domain-containing membrane protein YozV/ribosomal protein L40E
MVVPDISAVEESKLSESKLVYCSDCGARISNKAKACPKCGAETNYAKEQNVVKRDSSTDFIALVLTFFIPGLGQMFKGHLGKGIFLFFLNCFFGGFSVICLFFGWIIFAVIGAIFGPLGTGLGAIVGVFIGMAIVIITFIIWIMTLYDAYTIEKTH